MIIRTKHNQSSAGKWDNTGMPKRRRPHEGAGGMRTPLCHLKGVVCTAAVTQDKAVCEHSFVDAAEMH